MEGFESFRRQRPSAPRVAGSAKYYFATRIIGEQHKRPRGERLEDRPALWSVENARRAAFAKPPNPRKRFEEPDFLRSHFLDGRIDPVFGCADLDRMELTELKYGGKLIQTRARGFHPRLGDRQIDARHESQQAEA